MNESILVMKWEPNKSRYTFKYFCEGRNFSKINFDIQNLWWTIFLYEFHCNQIFFLFWFKFSFFFAFVQKFKFFSSFNFSHHSTDHNAEATFKFPFLISQLKTWFLFACQTFYQQFPSRLSCHFQSPTQKFSAFLFRKTWH